MNALNKGEAGLGWMRMLSPLIAISGMASGDIVINELGNAPSQRLIKWSQEGVPSIGAGSGWFENEFNDSQWAVGEAPLGWGYSEIGTSVAPIMRGQVPSLYLRHTFEVSSSAANDARDLELEIQADDGYIVWLNGREVARSNLGAADTIVFADQTAFNPYPEGDTPEEKTLGEARDYLQSGENVIAVQVVNYDIDTPLKFEARLRNSNWSERFIEYEANWKYTSGLVEPSGGVFEPSFASGASQLSVAWGEPNFDLSSWQNGSGPVGFDATPDYELGTNLKDEMRNIATSLYLRQNFELLESELNDIDYLEMTVDYDDGYIAYLNGREVARGTMGTVGTFFSHDSAATGTHNASMDAGNLTHAPELIVFDKTLLQAGTNTLAIQLHNESIDSSDLIADVTLESIGDNIDILVNGEDNWDYFIGNQEPSTPATSIASPEAEFSDWIELHNNGNNDVDLSNWTLSDDAEKPSKWVLPAGTIIPSGEYLLILADDNEEFNGNTTYLHAGFNLDQGGEYLGLFDSNGSLRDAFDPEFPELLPTQSWGRNAVNPSILGYLAIPTPGKANVGETALIEAAPVDFSIEGGFHPDTISLALTTETSGAEIYYTTDGTNPTLLNGTLYSGPLTLEQIDSSSGHVIRACAIHSGTVPSPVRTHTYLIAQSPSLNQTPALILTEEPERAFFAPWGVLSIVGGTFIDNEWFSTGREDYHLPLLRGRPYERPVYAEYYYPDGREGWRESCGVRVAGSESARPRLRLDSIEDSPWRTNAFEKPSFNLFFRGEYGSKKLEHPFIAPDYDVSVFDGLRVRAGKNDVKNPFVKDEFMRRLFREMGQESALGVFNSLYINGELKGYYNTVERLTEDFMQEHFHSNEDWDVRKVGGFESGTSDHWNETTSLLEQDLSDEAHWNEVLSRVDVVNIADYFLLNIYGATWDWPSNNWIAARERSQSGHWRLFVWDAEGSMGHQGRKEVDYDTIGDDLLGDSKILSHIFQDLYQSDEWRLIVADRIHKHMFNDGVLDDRSSSGTVTRTKDELIAELQPLVDFVREEDIEEDWHDDWVDENNGRRAHLLGPRDTFFEDHGLWPDTEPIEFDEHGGTVNSGFELDMVSPSGGTIYYTLDGSDPREFGGSVSPATDVFSNEVTLSDGYVTVKARALKNGEWSALTEADFAVGIDPPESGDLVISEFMYHALDPSPSELAQGFDDEDAFEFLILTNISSDPLDISGVQFDDGIEFSFADSQVGSLAPGESTIIVSDLNGFLSRYGNTLTSQIAGQWIGGLKNSGENIRLVDHEGSVLQEFTYDDSAPWPESPDGDGFSMMLQNPTSNPNHTDPSNWVASPSVGGTPGASLNVTSYQEWRALEFSAADAANEQISGTSADPDGDGYNNFLEFALGMNPNNNALTNALQGEVITENGERYLAITFRQRPAISGLSYTLEESSNLSDWSPATPVPVGNTQTNPDGTETITLRSTIPASPTHSQHFFRVQVSDS